MTESEKLVEAVAQVIDPGAWTVRHPDEGNTPRRRAAMITAERVIAKIDGSGTHRVERMELRQAAEEFVAKVDRGEARSVRSYAAFKAALAERRGEGW